MLKSPLLAETGAIAQFAWRSFCEGFRPRYEVREWLYQCYVVGYQSLPMVGITHDLRRMTGRLDSSAIWHLLGDKTPPVTVHQSLVNVAVAMAQLRTASHDMALLTAGVRQGRGPLGYLLTNKTLAGQLGHAGQQVAASSDTLTATLAGLQRQVQTGGGPVQTQLTDTTLSRQLRQSMRNVEQSTNKLDQSMEALQHDFLLRSYLRRQEKKKAQNIK